MPSVRDWLTGCLPVLLLSTMMQARYRPTRAPVARVDAHRRLPGADGHHLPRPGLARARPTRARRVNGTLSRDCLRSTSPRRAGGLSVLPFLTWLSACLPAWVGGVGRVMVYGMVKASGELSAAECKVVQVRRQRGCRMDGTSHGQAEGWPSE